MKTSIMKGIGLGALALALVGCSHSPMDALKSDDTNSNYDVQYWQKTASSDPSLFNQAVEYCSQNPTKPNCAPVNSIAANTVPASAVQVAPSTEVVNS